MGADVCRGWEHGLGTGWKHGRWIAVELANTTCVGCLMSEKRGFRGHKYGVGSRCLWRRERVPRVAVSKVAEKRGKEGGRGRKWGKRDGERKIAI